MIVSRKMNLYHLLGLACGVGYIWVFLAIFFHIGNQFDTPSLCILKEATGVPCPSCGTTRSVVSLIEGNLHEAWHWNPFGYIIIVILIIGPIWILRDRYYRSNSMVVFFHLVEAQIQRRIIALPLIMLVITNWIWNIYKGL